MPTRLSPRELNQYMKYLQPEDIHMSGQRSAFSLFLGTTVVVQTCISRYCITPSHILLRPKVQGAQNPPRPAPSHQPKTRGAVKYFKMKSQDAISSHRAKIVRMHSGRFVHQGGGGGRGNNRPTACAISSLATCFRECCTADSALYCRRDNRPTEEGGVGAAFGCIPVQVTAGNAYGRGRSPNFP